jgi:hypothetical protein
MRYLLMDVEEQPQSLPLGLACYSEPAQQSDTKAVEDEGISIVSDPEPRCIMPCSVTNLKEKGNLILNFQNSCRRTQWNACITEYSFQVPAISVEQA